MFLMLVFYVCVFLCAASCVINDDDDDIRLLNVFARVFLVASRLSIVCLSVFNVSSKVRNGF